MAEEIVDDGRWDRPDSVYSAVVLWWTAAGATALLALINVLSVVDRVRDDELPRLIGGFLFASVLAALAITQFNRGRPVARVALTGMAVYYTWSLVIGLSVVFADKSDASVFVVLIEIARTLCAAAAAVLSFTPTARVFFRAYNAHAPRSQAANLAGVLWMAGIMAIAVPVAANFIDSLPSHGRSWIQWATGRNAVGDALLASLLLCLLPAYVAIARQFDFGRQWARVTLTVLGTATGAIAVLQVLDGLDRGMADDMAPINVIFGIVQLLALIAALAMSYRPAVNKHFREAKALSR